MYIKSDLGTGDNIVANKTPQQEIRGICPTCRNRLYVPIDDALIDYKSLYLETKERLIQALKYNGELSERLRVNDK